LIFINPAELVLGSCNAYQAILDFSGSRFDKSISTYKYKNISSKESFEDIHLPYMFVRLQIMVNYFSDLSKDVDDGYQLMVLSNQI
jgi:hypothetical protein